MLKKSLAKALGTAGRMMRSALESGSGTLSSEFGGAGGGARGVGG